MADRVPAAITVGATIAAALMPEFIKTVKLEDLSTEWDGEPFDEQQLLLDNPLHLYAQEVANGEFNELEEFCRTDGLAFRRWSGGSSGSFLPEIVVWTGQGERHVYRADEDEHAVITAEDARQLGSYDAILGYFADAAFDVPPFRVG
ncbi:hypothetical protein [uncultured Sphingomonas sp.]|uniref:hypothetical protein n=1 Tax=uncultured Sphingomonas sp. TaxID=158754 RepID=UPI0035CAEDEA